MNENQPNSEQRNPTPESRSTWPRPRALRLPPVEQRFFHLVTVLLALSLVSSCQLFGGMRVDPVATSTQKPSNVAVYLSVENDEEPVYGLSEENFKIYENELPLDPKQTGLRLLDRNVAASHHVVVLVDLSGAAVEEGGLTLLAAQLAPFVERLRDRYHVSVYGFDGSDELAALGNFPMLNSSRPSQPVTKDDLSALTSFVQKDSSSNLNGAVIKALGKVDEELSKSPLPITLGTLVIIARGPDLAARTKEDALLTALDSTEHQVFAVTVGSSEDESLAETLGRDGHSQTRVFENLENSLADVATMVERDLSRYYLLSYCSPGRSGERTLLIEVTKPQGSGDKLEGSTQLQFNATGFTSGCDSDTVPLFGKGGVSTTSQPASQTRAAPPSTTPEAGDATNVPADEQPTTDEPIPPPSSDTYAP